MIICPYTNCPHQSYCTKHGTICNGYLFEIAKLKQIEEIRLLKEAGNTASEINKTPRFPITQLRCTGCSLYEECSKGSITTPLKEPQRPLELEPRFKFKCSRIYPYYSIFKYKRAKAKYPHNFKIRGSKGLCQPIHKLAQKKVKEEYGYKDEIFVDNWELFEDRSEDSEKYRSSFDETAINYYGVPQVHVSPVELPLWSGRVEQKPFPDITKQLLYISGGITDLKYIRNTTDIFKVIIASGNPYRSYQVKGKEEWYSTEPGGSRMPVQPGFVVRNVVPKLSDLRA